MLLLLLSPESWFLRCFLLSLNCCWVIGDANARGPLLLTAFVLLCWLWMLVFYFIIVLTVDFCHCCIILDCRSMSMYFVEILLECLLPYIFSSWHLYKLDVFSPRILALSWLRILPILWQLLAKISQFSRFLLCKPFRWSCWETDAIS